MSSLVTGARRPRRHLFLPLVARHGLWIATVVCSVLCPSIVAPSYARPEEEPAPRVALRSPQLLSVLPMGARPGSSTPVELRGEFLDRAERAVFTSPDVSAVVKKAAFSRVELEVQVSPEAEPGPRYFRLVTPRGASNLLLFRVSQWPSLVESEPHNELDTRALQNLPLVEWPVLISGQLATPRDIDLFRFRAKAGQALTLSVLAARNWSTADLSLALLDGGGRAIRQDDGRLIWDPHLDFVCPKDGDYVAAVMLTRMPAGGQSRTDLVYQLAIGPVPLLLSVFPLYVRRGESVNLQVRGEFLDSQAAWTFEAGTLAPASFSPPLSDGALKGVATAPLASPAAISLVGRVAAEAAPGAYFLSPKHASGLVSPLAVLIAEFPTISESAKNDDLSAAQAISLPVTVNGKIENDWDEDFYRFEAEANDALTFIVDAEKWGSPLDARLTLLNAAGKILAANDDAKVIGRPLNRDPKLEYTFKERGTYYVKVHSLQRRGGEDFVYALTARRQAPGFTLGLGAERLAVNRGDKASWNVTVQREEGFQGEVTVEVSGLPAGVTAQPLRIKGDQTSGSIALAAASDAPLQAARVEVVGKALVNGKERAVKARVPAARIIGSGPGFASYQATEAWVAVVNPPLFSLESAASEVFLVRGGRAEFGVKIVRRAGIEGDPDFALENLPAGVTLENVEIVDQGRMARLTLRASENAAVGRVPDVTIIGTMNGQDARRSESAPRINVQVD